MMVCVIPCGAARTKLFAAACASSPDVAMKFELVSPFPWSAMTSGSFCDATADGTTTMTARACPAALRVCVVLPAVSVPLPPEDDDDEDDDEDDEDDDDVPPSSVPPLLDEPPLDDDEEDDDEPDEPSALPSDDEHATTTSEAARTRRTDRTPRC
jgi:hypothetical protein